MKAYDRICNRGEYSSSLFSVRKPDGSDVVICSDACFDVTDPLLLCEVIEENVTQSSSTQEHTQG